MMLTRIAAAACLLALATACAAPRSDADADAAGSCDARVGQWLDPATGDTLGSEQLFSRLSQPGIVLLGESHTTAADHRWQHYTLAALHSRNADLVVSFEMFPRAVQPVLDAWSAGELREDEFLAQSNWQEVWGYDAGYYLPLLHFVRQHRLPAVAMNVDRGLVRRVGQEGWQALPADEREGLSDPAPASEAYREYLAGIYAYKQTIGGDEADDTDTILASEEFGRFVEAQLTWDRGMAEALAAAHRRQPGAVVVGIVGRGHLEQGFGIPHQLADLGIEPVDSLLPIDAGADCADLPADIASAIYVVDSSGEARLRPHARLGVMIEDGDGGVRVTEVIDDSVAQASGVEPGDLILSAAGFDTEDTGDLIEIVQRQAPGTWLPLKIKRGDDEVEITARFPQSFE